MVKGLRSAGLKPLRHSFEVKLNESRSRWIDVVIQTEQVEGVVLPLGRQQPRVVLAVRGSNPRLVCFLAP
jgi:hypothetical protein